MWQAKEFTHFYTQNNKKTQLNKYIYEKKFNYFYEERVIIKFGLSTFKCNDSILTDF